MSSDEKIKETTFVTIEIQQERAQVYNYNAWKLMLIITKLKRLCVR